MNNLFQIDHLAILSNLKSHNAYYIGGSLCVDLGKDVLCYNLNETVFFFNSGQKKLLSIAETRQVFDTYKSNKGETEYYKSNYQNSFLKHIN